MPQIALVVGAVASVAGTISARNAQRRSARAQQRQQAASARRQRRQALREAAISRAQAVASASASGATGSSAALGGQASLGSQLGSNFGFSSQMTSLSRDISSAQSSMANAQALSSIGGSIFSVAAGTPQGQQSLQNFSQGFSNLFNRPPQGRNISAFRNPQG